MKLCRCSRVRLCAPIRRHLLRRPSLGVCIFLQPQAANEVPTDPLQKNFPFLIGWRALNNKELTMYLYRDCKQDLDLLGQGFRLRRTTKVHVKINLNFLFERFYRSVLSPYTFSFIRYAMYTDIILYDEKIAKRCRLIDSALSSRHTIYTKCRKTTGYSFRDR